MKKHTQKTTFIVCLLLSSILIPSLQGADKTKDEQATKPKVPQIWFNLAKDGSKSQLVELYEYCSIDVNAKDKDGYTALHLVATNAHLSLLEYLVGVGADVNARDKEGRTALMCCVLNAKAPKGSHYYAETDYYLECVKVLVQQGADVNAINNEGHTVFYYSLLANISHFKIVKYLDAQVQKYITGLKNSTKITEKGLKNSALFRLAIIQYWQKETKISEIEKDIVSIIVRYGDTEIQ